MNINNKQPYFKSAVAFFFLFFLHGTSIGNGQQGISYNYLLSEPFTKKSRQRQHKNECNTNKNNKKVAHI